MLGLIIHTLDFTDAAPCSPLLCDEREVDLAT